MKTILCFGDSNTYGYIPGSGGRYGPETRWPRQMAGLLGPDYEVVEEGLNGRTTAFSDRIEPYRCGLDAILPCVMSHEPLALLIIMLGVNDTKERFHVSAEEIGYGLEELIMKVAGYYHFREGMPKVLVVAPAALGDMSGGNEFNEDSRKKSERLPEIFREISIRFGCEYLDAGAVISGLGCDHIHLTPQAHLQLAQALAEQVRQILSEP